MHKVEKKEGLSQVFLCHSLPPTQPAPSHHCDVTNTSMLQLLLEDLTEEESLP